ncbi:MAG: hypothetical protein U0232_18155 [Thermomicrobiales bacterium]
MPRRLAGALAAQVVAPGVERDAREPGGEGGVVAEAAEGAPCFDESFVDDLGGVGRVAGERVGDAMNGLMMPLNGRRNAAS